MPLTSDTAKERTSSKCCRAAAGCCTFASFTAVRGSRLGGLPSPHFPQGHVPCGAGEAVALLILAHPIRGWDRSGMRQAAPPVQFLCKEIASRCKEKGAFIWLFCYGAAGACRGTRDELSGHPQQNDGPLGILTRGWVSLSPP